VAFIENLDYNSEACILIYSEKKLGVLTWILIVHFQQCAQTVTKLVLTFRHVRYFDLKMKKGEYFLQYFSEICKRYF